VDLDSSRSTGEHGSPIGVVMLERPVNDRDPDTADLAIRREGIGIAGVLSR
jgi:hypothetical protein